MPRRSELRLTDHLARTLSLPAKGTRKHRDGQIRGFAVQLTHAGGRTWCLIYQSPVHAVERLYTIAPVAEMNAEAATGEVLRLKAMVRDGLDPLDERERARRERREHEEAPTVLGLAKRYEAEHLPTKRPRPAADDRSMIAADVLPALGKRPVAEVTKAEIRKLHRDITGRAPYRANRTLALLRTMFALAIEWGLRPDKENPARGGRGGVAMNPEDHRERFLSPAEIARLAAVLDAHPERTTVALIRFLMLTGARFGEAANATWNQFDLERGVWTKPSSHTKAKRQHVTPLSAPALALLVELKATATGPLVFPSPRTARPLVTIKTSWTAIRRAADLPGVRIHDLRHSFASALASSGASLQLIGSLLGHSQIGTTMRYAHLADDARREAVERVGALVTGGTGRSGEVVDLPRRGAR